jgi:hypothetical protein
LCGLCIFLCFPVVGLRSKDLPNVAKRNISLRIKRPSLSQMRIWRSWAWMGAVTLGSPCGLRPSQSIAAIGSVSLLEMQNSPSGSPPLPWQLPSFQSLDRAPNSLALRPALKAERGSHHGSSHPVSSGRLLVGTHCHPLHR